MLTLGINEGINASVVLCNNGEIVFALQEERVNREKEYIGFPHAALKFTFEYLGLSVRDIIEPTALGVRISTSKQNPR